VQTGTQLELHPSPRRTILGKYNFERITTRKHNHKWVRVTGEMVLVFLGGWDRKAGPVANGKWSVGAALGDCPSACPFAIPQLHSTYWPLICAAVFLHEVFGEVRGILEFFKKS